MDGHIIMSSHLRIHKSLVAHTNHGDRWKLWKGNKNNRSKLFKLYKRQIAFHPSSGTEAYLLPYAFLISFVNSPVALFLWPWYFLIESAPSELVESKR